jgi:hypothetical protein
MNKHTIPFRFFVAVLALVSFASCSKMDAELPQAPQTTIAAPAATDAAKWNTKAAWSAAAHEGESRYSVSFSDSSLSSKNLKNGLVLVYARPKGSTTVQSLPFSEGGQNWYYQTSTEKLEIVVESANAPSASEFAYFILNAEKIADLKTKGYTKSALMSLTYESAQTLLN